MYEDDFLVRKKGTKSTAGDDQGPFINPIQGNQASYFRLYVE